MAKIYNCLPSDLLNIEDEYTAYCFNEACSMLRAKLEAGEEPRYNVDVEDKEPKHYSSMKDFYDSLN